MAAAERETDEREAIRRLGAEWQKAIRAKDTTRILALVTDDVVFMPQNAPSIVGKQAVADMYRAFFARYTVEQTFAPEEIQVSGDWAFTWGADLLTLLPVDGSAPLVIQARGLTIMKRQGDGSWKFARGINNMDQPPKPAGPLNTS